MPKPHRKNDNNFASFDDDNSSNVEQIGLGDLSGLDSGSMDRIAYGNDKQDKIDQLEAEREQAIIRTGEKSFQFRNFSLTATELVIPPGTGQEELDDFARFLSGWDTASNWWHGDWANYQTSHITGDSLEANRERNITYNQLAIKHEINEKTLRNCAYVARKVTPSRRRDGLSFSHHAEIAKLDPKQQTKYLNMAENEGLSVSQLREKIRAEDSSASEKLTASKIERTALSFAKVLNSLDFKKMKKTEKKAVDAALKPHYELIFAIYQEFKDE